MSDVAKKLTSVKGLGAVGLVSDDPALDDVGRAYDIAVTPHIYDLIKDSPDLKHDPVARQYIPTTDELVHKSDEDRDPIGDDIHSPVKGIVHRYKDRVLFKVTNICAVYCRYCFRREMVGSDVDPLRSEDFDAAISYIENHPEIWEVILTGGDPLVLSDRRLQKIIDALCAIDHVKVIRIHTRVPVANPDQITKTKLSVLKRINKLLQIVIHINHVDELTHAVERKILDLRQLGGSILSQSVLLKGVNDDAKVLEALFRKLILLHVRPYYLHHPDRAKGTSHFRVSIQEGLKIMRQLQGSVSGVCLPKYMLDIPGGYGKIPLYDGVAVCDDDHTYRVVDPEGCEHIYEDEG